MSDKVEVCPYCQGTYPHQGPAGCDMAKLLEERKGRPICGVRIWPYTENNICVLDVGHISREHQDAQGRGFAYATKRPDDAPHCRHHIQFRSDCAECVSAREFGG